MGHLPKGIHCLASYPFGGGIRQDILRIGLFQVLQLPQEPVIFKVWQGGIVQHIIPVTRLVKQRRQILYSLLWFHNCLLCGRTCPARLRR